MLEETTCVRALTLLPEEGRTKQGEKMERESELSAKTNAIEEGEREREKERHVFRRKNETGRGNRSFSRNELERNMERLYDPLLTLCFMDFSKVTLVALS